MTITISLGKDRNDWTWKPDLIRGTGILSLWWLCFYVRVSR
jgi:hypothetical protein